MRPRPDAAENDRRAADRRDLEDGFNEAAARCRGKPETGRLVAAGLEALQ